MDRVEEILEYWLGDTLRDVSCAKEWMSFWFESGADLDQPIREKFAADVEAAASGETKLWEQNARGRLAKILLLDQFTRNIFRGKPEAFANDDEALALTQAGIIAGHDGQLGPVERVFFYMPMQHAESLPVQMQSVALYEALAESVPDSVKKLFGGFTKYAELHRDIVARFGRFPHRNAILGRESTPEEREYLAGDAPTFGQ
ncbi:MAG: DUF924 domain-containing protein [Gammaproteobacteria bacterium]|nr:DUF924 domain-containing protein [Gammaproteobacteria bacterium]